MTQQAHNSPYVMILDEDRISMTTPFLFETHDFPTRVIFRMPALPPAYFQLGSFSKWYEDRIRNLRAYASLQNVKYAYSGIKFEVLTGSRQNIVWDLAHKVEQKKIYQA